MTRYDSPQELLDMDILHASEADFLDDTGTDLTGRWRRFQAFWDARAAAGLDSYQNILLQRSGPRAEVLDRGGTRRSGVNFAGQDHLSLSGHPALRDAAVEAIGRFGVHGTGPLTMQGTSAPLIRLQERLAELLGCRAAIVFPSGWAAGYGTIRALVRDGDHVVIDSLAHVSLQEGAAAATRHVHRVQHGSPEAVSRRLAEIRAADARCGILTVTETLFALDSTSPDLRALRRACDAFGATLLVGAAHDLGAMGDGGLGVLGEQGMIGEVDIVVGSFARALAGNGGFAAFRRPVLREALIWRTSTLASSSTLSPLQATVVNAALDIVRSAEGAQRRRRLMANVMRLRSGLEARAFETGGQPGPIVPMMIGPDAQARHMTRTALARGALVNLVEHPAVSRNAARWRLHVMADHLAEHVDTLIGVAVAAREAMTQVARPGSA